MKSRRSRMDIIADILKSTINGAKKTRIIYKACLNFKQMQRYLPLLLKRGLIKTAKMNGRGVYKTTKKGFIFLEKCEELKETLNH